MKKTAGSSGITSTFLADALEGLPERLVQKDEAALKELIDKTKGALIAHVSSIVGSSEHSEDIVAELYEDVWKRPQLFDPSLSSFKTWLYMKVRCRAIDMRRKMKKRREYSAAFFVEFCTTYPHSCEHESSDPNRERYARLRHIFDHFDFKPEHRICLEMAWFQGISQTKIAEQVGEPLGTVKARIRRAFARIQQVVLDDPAFAD